MEERQTLRQATKLWQEAYRYQMEGELDRAIERYHCSIEAHPTAEAHTFLGCALSVEGRFEEATEECLRAIAIDPEFGNPYNDIGVYMMKRDKLDEAIPWLEKAKQAKRYEPRQFPFMNLGQIYVRQRRWWEALREFEGAVRLVPRDHDAAKMLHHVRARLNRRSAREGEVLHAKGSSLLIATVGVTNSSTGCRSGSPAPRGRSSASSTGRTAVKATSETRCYMTFWQCASPARWSW